MFSEFGKISHLKCKKSYVTFIYYIKKFENKSNIQYEYIVAGLAQEAGGPGVREEELLRGPGPRGAVVVEPARPLRRVPAMVCTVILLNYYTGVMLYCCTVVLSY